jgi:NAD(P)-dependent dehydrogenase (short-subunit alcohol dehydrogenase family)
MATFENARQLVSDGITANVVHPGMVATNLVRAPGVIGLAWRLMAPLIRTEQQGAATPLHVALADELAGTTGQYFKDNRPVTPNLLVRDPALVRAVWQATERIVGMG